MIELSWSPIQEDVNQRNMEDLEPEPENKNHIDEKKPNLHIILIYLLYFILQFSIYFNNKKSIVSPIHLMIDKKYYLFIIN